jgi:hypothetical protein
MKAHGKYPLGRKRGKWEYNKKTDLRDISYEGAR